MRAIVPSSRSLNAKIVMSTTPRMNLPVEKQMIALADAPTVPTRVTASGLTWSRMRSRAGGSMTTLATLRAAGLLSIALLMVPRHDERRAHG